MRTTAHSRATFIGTSGTAVGIAIVMSLLGATQANAATPAVDLRTATSYAVLAGEEITNIGPSVISGDIGVSPGSSAGGFPPGTVTNGNIHAADAVTLQAKNDLTTAYTDAANRTPVTTLVNDLANQTLVPGIYSDTIDGLSNTGKLTLDAQNDPDAVWIFKSTSELVTSSASSVVFLNDVGNPCNVFWQVTSSATLGSGSSMLGTVMALTSITAATGASVEGRLLARNGAVTLDTNTITVPIGCRGTIAPGGTSTSPVTPPPTETIATPAVPELAATGEDNALPTLTAAGLIASGLLLFLLARRRSSQRGIRRRSA